MSQISKRMMLTVSICAVAIPLISLPFGQYVQFFPFALGVIMGCALNLLKIYLLERVVNKCTESEMEKKDASNYVRLQYMLRLLLTGVVLVAAALMPHSETLWGAAAGVFTMQIAAWSAKGKDLDEKAQNTQ